LLTYYTPKAQKSDEKYRIIITKTLKRGMTRYKLTIEFDGTGLVGWQRQDNGPSVQQTIEDGFVIK